MLIEGMPAKSTTVTEQGDPLASDDTSKLSIKVEPPKHCTLE